MVLSRIRPVPNSLFGIPRSTTRNDPHASRNEISSPNRTSVRSHFARSTGITRSRFFRPHPFRFGRGGFSTLGGCLALLASTAGIGLYQLARHVEARTRSQIALDRCTGEFLIRLRAASVSIEQSYQRANAEIIAAKAACVLTGGTACPEVQEALQIALNIEAGIETAVQLYWNEQKSIWEVEIANRCELEWFVQKSSFPVFPYSIVNPALGMSETLPLRELAKKHQKLILELKDGANQSQATALQILPAKWSVSWTN
jgi:hypothetical protein